ncbi:MAG TPA: hypothetical protein VH682_07420 [Gemmataceae bacterium]|jgi:hypothetical protein
MPSTSYHHWQSVRATELDEITQAHTAVGGSARGRRYTTQQINRAYAMLLASHFQGFCRDLHTECVNHIMGVIAPPPALRDLAEVEFTRGRQLDRSNAQPSSLGADFGRLGINLWDRLQTYDAASEDWKRDLDLLNEWRNAIAHQEFTSPKLGGIMKLRLAWVRQWRASCGHLARAMDEVMRRHLQFLTSVSPW